MGQWERAAGGNLSSAWETGEISCHLGLGDKPPSQHFALAVHDCFEI